MRPVQRESAEVIQFEDLQTERLTVRDRYDAACAHKRTEIDERLRIVECRDCKERLDPIEVLLDIARHWRRESHAARRVREYERKEAEKRLERDKRYVRQHIVCHGCGLTTRLTVGRLTQDDVAAWDQHFLLPPVAERVFEGGGYTWPAYRHRRRTENDVERHHKGLAFENGDAWSAATQWVDRRPPQ